MHSDPTTHYGRHSDGKSAAARDCSVRLDLSGLDVTSSDGMVRFRWPYDSLKASEPIRPQSIDIILSSSKAPGETLFVPGADFAATLGTRAPQLGVRAERWRHARPWIIAAGVIVATFLIGKAAGWSPMQTAARLLPQSWRERLGTAAIEQMAENRKRCTDTSGVAALDALTRRLSEARSAKGEGFKITVVDWDLLNAFAVPGNQIVMTKELIVKAESADEVAGVLAHEMGHGIELHPETGIIRAVGLAATLELMMGGSSGTLANMGLMLAQLGYTRAAEREADEHALLLLRNAGISQQGLAAFFKRVLKEEGGYANTSGSEAGEAAKDKPDDEDKTAKRLKRALDIFSTHPPTAERAEHIRMSGSYPATPALTAGEWESLKKICNSTAPISEPPATTP